MQVLAKIRVDMARKGPRPVVDAVQYDAQSRVLDVELLQEGEPWTPPQGTIGIVSVHKADGTDCVYETDEAGVRAVEISEGRALVLLAAQALAAAGDALVGVTFYAAGGARLAMFNLRLRVQRAVVDDDAITSSDYFDILTEEIDRVLRTAAGAGGAVWIRGTYATLEELEEAVPEPVQGHMYNVGEEPPYSIYMWDETEDGEGQWLDQGHIEGPAGPQGPQGNGIAGIAKTGTSGDVDTYTITFTDGSTATFTVTNGSDGEDGSDGAPGVGIASVAKTGTSGLVDTYTITLTNGFTYTFNVTNGEAGQNGSDGSDGAPGVGITSVTKLGTSGNTDTYKILFTDGHYTTFEVKNGNGIASIAKTGTVGLVDTYTITMQNGSTATFTVTNGRDGRDGTDGSDGVGIASVAKTGASGNVDTYTITLQDGRTSTFTVTNGTSIADIEPTATYGDTTVYTITLTNGNTFDFEVVNGSSINSIAKVGSIGLQDTYRITLTNGVTFLFYVTNGADGSDGAPGVGIETISKIGTEGLVDTYRITLQDGRTTTFTVTNGAPGRDGTDGARGATGERGATGVGLDIKGQYATLADLQAAVPSPATGDAYMVGSTAPLELYIYSGSAWTNCGAVPGIPVDDTLTASGQAADAKVTGERIEHFVRDVETAREWRQGSISTTDGTAGSGSTRIHTHNFFELQTGKLRVSVPIGYKFSLRFYTSAAVAGFTGTTDWQTGTQLLTVTTGQFVRLVMARDDDTDITPSDGINMSAGYVWPLNTADETEASLRVATATRNWYSLTQGTISIITGGTSNATNRVRTGARNAKAYADKRMHIWAATGLKYRVNVYDNGTFAYSFDWITGAWSIKLSDTQTIRVAVAREDEADVTPSEITDDQFIMYGYIDNGNASTSVNRMAMRELLGEKIEQMHGRYRITNAPTYAPRPLTLLHFSDIHADYGNAQRIIKFAQIYENSIDDVVHTGDSVSNSYADGMTWFAKLAGCETILNVIGNHDTRVGDNWQAKTAAEAYAAYFAPWVTNWGVTYTPDVCYYFKDYTTQGVRLIVLDSQHQDAAQAAWFAQTLEDARQAGLTVVAAAHVKGSYAVIPLETTFDDSWYYGNGISTGTYAYPRYLEAEYAAAVNTFKQAGGQFACWICGHGHFSRFGVVQDYTDQLCIGVTNASAVNATSAVAERAIGTKAMDAFNLMSVDTYLGIVKLLPVGNEYDLLMRHRESICWDYKNARIMYTR